jgi:hypothetical protein
VDRLAIFGKLRLMSELHNLIESQGKRAALLAMNDRREVDAAASYMADEDAGMGFLYSGWCQAALPHRKLPDDRAWQIRSEHVTLIVEPGRRPEKDSDPTYVGVPYGSRARLIMFYLQSEALRTGRREVELGTSMRCWLDRMGVPVGGKSMTAVRDQAERISRCRLSFHIRGERRVGMSQQNIVDRAIFLEDDGGAQQSLSLEVAKLSESFFEELKRHPVPLEDAAIRAINNNSMALDSYAWLAYRLHALTTPILVRWTALKGQFGTGFSRAEHFKPKFIENLRLALAVYRDAKVDIQGDGLLLHPSRPPVAPRMIGGTAKVHTHMPGNWATKKAGARYGAPA